jgi:hypothetical protein
MDLRIDRRSFIASLGGSAAVALLSAEQKADALEHHLEQQLNETSGNKKFPTVADLEAQIETRPFRRGVGGLFVSPQGNVQKLPPMPEQPTLVDFFNLRWSGPRNHCYQSASRAQKTGQPEEIVFACLLHDTVQALARTDHGWWAGQLYEPYVSARVAFAIRYHAALRFYPDSSAGYEYPDLYKQLYGEDYVPPRYIEDTYQMVRKHKWYTLPRLVTVNDLYAFDPTARVSIDPFVDLIGKHFRQPREGLGNDGSPVAHMWRTMAHPDAPL